MSLPLYDGSYADYVQSLFDWVDAPVEQLLPNDGHVQSSLSTMADSRTSSEHPLPRAPSPSSDLSSTASSSPVSSTSSSPQASPRLGPIASPVIPPFLGFVLLMSSQFANSLGTAPVFPVSTISDPNFPPGAYALSRTRLGYLAPGSKSWVYDPFNSEQSAALPILPHKLSYFKLVGL